MKHSFESAGGERAVAQMRTGYTRLNEYLHNVNVKESNKCQCEAVESVSQYLLFCPLFEKERSHRERLLENCGIMHLDLNILLDARKDDELKEWRSVIVSELETYVVKTERFVTRSANQ